MLIVYASSKYVTYSDFLYNHGVGINMVMFKFHFFHHDYLSRYNKHHKNGIRSCIPCHMKDTLGLKQFVSPSLTNLNPVLRSTQCTFLYIFHQKITFQMRTFKCYLNCEKRNRNKKVMVVCIYLRHLTGLLQIFQPRL